MTSKTEKNIGKWFETSLVMPAFAGLARQIGLYYHRFLDTHAAGSHVPNAPGDYYAMLRGMPILVECKASIKHMSLKGCLADAVEDHQVGTHRLWIKAGGVSLFLFYSDQTRLIEFWRGETVISARQHSAVLKPGDKFGICKSEELGSYFEKRIAVIEGS